jgi:inosine-uridine nucleoside N-ribohydrolase
MATSADYGKDSMVRRKSFVERTVVPVQDAGEEGEAVDFLIRAVNENQGQTTIIAIGPLTNIATAIRQSPSFPKNVKRLSIMGGAIGSLPGGSGNLTHCAPDGGIR